LREEDLGGPPVVIPDEMRGMRTLTARQAEIDKKAQIALEKSLRRAGTFSPIMNTLKQGYSNSKKVGKTPPGY
jgi:hypothetical protein